VSAHTVPGRDTDLVFLVITGICVLLAAAIVAVMLYFVFRYNSKRSPSSYEVKASPTMELSFLGGSVALVLAMFVLGWDGYEAMYSKAPDGALAVKTTGQMWQWRFEYPGGRLSNSLILPAKRPVRIDLSSADVIHSFYVPAFRVKQDALPGTQRSIWFVPDTEGTYDLFCTEYCGTGHSRMITKSVVVSGAECEAWLAGVKEIEPVAAPAEAKTGAPDGKGLYESKGCSVCHSIDGTTIIGPTFKGLFGSKVKVTTNGKVREVVVDEEYIRRSELEPTADIVEGSPPGMPPQKGGLEEEEIKALIEFIKGLK